MKEMAKALEPSALARWVAPRFIAWRLRPAWALSWRWKSFGNRFAGIQAKPKVPNRRMPACAGPVCRARHRQARQTGGPACPVVWEGAIPLCRLDSPMTLEPARTTTESELSEP